eukprot:2667776-Amphidinium_carterae.1
MLETHRVYQSGRKQNAFGMFVQGCGDDMRPLTWTLCQHVVVILVGMLWAAPIAAKALSTWYEVASAVDLYLTQLCPLATLAYLYIL